MKRIILALCMLIILAVPSMAVLRINNAQNLITGGAGNFTNVTVNQRLTTPQFLISGSSFVGNITSDGNNFSFNVPSGTLSVNGQPVCLANGSNCAVSATDGSGGWTNTSTQTSTDLFIGYKKTATTPLDFNLSSTSESINFAYNLASAYMGAQKHQKRGNSTSATGNPASGDELLVIQGDVANGSGTMVRRSAFTCIADGLHDGSTAAGTRCMIKVTDRNTNNYVTAAMFTGTGLSVTNSSSAGLQPSDRLYVAGDMNVSQMIKLNVYAYPACTSALRYSIAVNSTTGRPMFCNSTAWVNMTTYG